MPNHHLALLGDSIFDNAPYTDGAPDVISHVRAALPSGWAASLFAEDGSTTHDLGPQIAEVGEDVTHVVVSIGGNDALANSDLLNVPVESTAEALALFGRRVDAFSRFLCRGAGGRAGAGAQDDGLHDLRGQPGAFVGAARARRADGVQRRHPAGRVRTGDRRHRSAPRLHGNVRLREPDRAVGQRREEDCRGHRRGGRRRGVDAPPRACSVSLRGRCLDRVPSLATPSTAAPIGAPAGGTPRTPRRTAPRGPALPTRRSRRG